MSKNIYVAGPMRGLPEFNFPAFIRTTDKLRAAGWTVFNPAERDLERGFDPTGLLGSDEELAALKFSLREALGDDTAWICAHADAIYLLDGWENSTGAVAERALGEALGLPVYEASHCLGDTKVRDVVRDVVRAHAASEITS